MIKRKRKIITFLILAIVVILLVVQGFIWAQDFSDRNAKGSFSVIHTGDIKGNMYATSESIGFAKAATLISDTRAQKENSLLIDSGDSLFGSVEAVANQGRPVISVMTQLDYDMINLGATDFLYGSNTLAEVKKSADNANLDVMSANLNLGSGLDFAMPYRLKQIGDLKVGFIGLMSEQDILGITDTYTDGLTVTNQIAGAKKSVKLLNKYSNVIVAITHLTNEQVDELIEAVPDIDVVFNSYDNMYPDADKAPRVQSGVLVCSAGNGLESINVTDLTFEKGELTSHSYQHISVADTKDVKENDDMLTLLNTISSNNILTGDQQIAILPESLDGDSADSMKKSTNFGCLLADAMVKDGKTDVAFVTGSDIVQSIDAGNLYKRDIYAALPNRDLMLTTELTGAQIVKVLEASVAKSLPNSAFLQVSNISFEYDPAKKVGERVSRVLVKSRPIELDEIYTVTTTLNTINSSEGYDFLKEMTFKKSRFLHDAFITHMRDLDNNYNYSWPRILRAN